ncbi:MAG: mechanosensitive ion channel family protein [Halioglobus sp.]
MVFLRTLAAVMLIMPFISQPVLANDDKEGRENVSELMAELDTDIAQWRLLSEQAGKAGGMDREALLYRQDDRSFRLLADADALAREVAKLPAEGAYRQEVEQKLVADLSGASDTVFLRLEELDKHIAKNTEQVDSLSAGARISTEAYLQALESVRFQYYEALVNHYESRKLLGLPFKDSKKRLQGILYLHAEALAGEIEFSTAAQEEVQGRFELDPGNADLELAITQLSMNHTEAVDWLSSVIELQDRLGVDTSDYKTVLLQNSTGVSVGLLQSGVIEQLLREWYTKARDTLVEKSPDLFLKLIVFLLVIFVFRFLSRMTRRVVRASCDRSTLDMSILLKDILVSASGGAVMILGVLMALSQIGITLGPMLAGLGVAGFIVGFALQDTLGNFAAGAMILIYRPYDVDDFVEVTGASGLVKKMNLVSTTITTFDNQTLVIPNSKIWGDVIKNVTAQKLRRVDLEFGIGYSDDIEKAERVLAEIVESHAMVLKSPETMIKLHTLGESSVNFVVRPWTKTDNYWDVYWDLTREVKMRFDREGISIPFPQRDVHLYPQE